MAFSRDWYATLGTSLPRRLRSTRLTGWSPNQTHFYWNIRGSFFYTRAQQKAANFSLTNKTRMAFSDELLVQHFYKAGGDEANRFYCCTAGGWEFLFMYASEMSMPCQIPAVSEFRHRRRSSSQQARARIRLAHSPDPINNSARSGTTSILFNWCGGLLFAVRGWTPTRAPTSKGHTNSCLMFAVRGQHETLVRNTTHFLTFNKRLKI